MATSKNDSFGALTSLDLSEGKTWFYALAALERAGLTGLERLLFSIRILLENALRHSGGGYVTEDHVRAVAGWSPTRAAYRQNLELEFERNRERYALLR